MAKYSTKETVHEQDVLTLTTAEYDTFNKIYKEALKDRLGKKGNDANLYKFFETLCLSTIIITDGTYRVEFVVEKIA